MGKELIATVLILIGITGGVVVCSAFPRLRDLAFVAMIFLAPMTELYDVNFVSRDFYRGTLRGFEFSLVDILSISIVISLLLVPRRSPRLYWPASAGFLLLFFAYCCFNVAIADPKLFGLFELSKMLRGLVMFFAVALYVRSERELKVLLLALAVVTLYEGFLALKQRYLYGIHRVFGTIDDSNSLSMFFCTVTPVMVAALNSRLPARLKAVAGATIPLAVVGVILTISRAGVVVLALVSLATILATMSFRVTARKLIIIVLVCVVGAGLGVKSWRTLKTRFQESNLDQEYGKKQNQGRGYYIRLAKAIAADRVFGVGLNNWSYWVSSYYGPKLGYQFVPYKGTDREPSTFVPVGSNVDAAQAAPAHSLFALTLGELGVPGLVLFVILWMRWFQMGVVFLWPRNPDPLRRIAVGIFFGMLGMFLQSQTEWVFRQSPLYYVFHILVGTLASLCFLRKEARKAERLAPVEEEQTWPAETDPEIGVEPIHG